jgi:hypothetical protein
MNYLLYHHPLISDNAWTISNTSNPGRSVINGSFSGELDLPGQDNNEITNRVDQLEKEVKGRDTEIRELNDRVNSFLSFSFLIISFVIAS